MDARVSLFIERLVASKHDRQMARALCREEMRYVRQHYGTKPVQDGDTSPEAQQRRADNYAAQKTQLTKYRNGLRDNRLRAYLPLMRLPKVDARLPRVAYDAQVTQKGENQQPIYRYQRLVDTALECLDSRFYSAVLLGLCLVSGRRPIELCVTGDFREDDTLPANELWFSGQAKSRDVEHAQEAFKIPLLCTASRFIDAWNRFRSMKDFTSYDAEQYGREAGQKFKKFGAIFGEAYDTHFARLMPAGTSPRNLRDAYALICYHVVRPTQPHIAINLYLRQILGHNDSKGQTAQSYQKFYLDGFDRPQREN